MMSDTAIFLQARINSKRLPAKILKHIINKTMIEHIIDRLAETLGYTKNITILSSFDAYPVLQKLFSKQKETNIFRGEKGEEHNVLKRFYDANKKINAKHIIRATADNPFTSIYHLKSSLEKHIEKDTDLSIYKDLPLGSGVEIIKASALNKAYECAVDNYDKEHVTPYIYKNHDKFKILKLMPDKIYRRPDIRITVDKEEDLRLAKAIFAKLYNGCNNFTLKEIIKLYDKEKL